MNRTATILLVLLTLAFGAGSATAQGPTGPRSKLNQWGLTGTPEFTPSYGTETIFGPGWQVLVELSTLFVATDSTPGAGATLLRCRRDTCVRGSCPPETLRHSGQFACPVEKFVNIPESHFALYSFRGWLAEGVPHVLAFRFEQIVPAEGVLR